MKVCRGKKIKSKKKINKGYSKTISGKDLFLFVRKMKYRLGR